MLAEWFRTAVTEQTDYRNLAPFSDHALRVESRRESLSGKFNPDFSDNLSEHLCDHMATLYNNG